MNRKHDVPHLLMVLAISWLVSACGGKPDRPPVVTEPPRTMTTSSTTTTAPVMADSSMGSGMDPGSDIERMSDPFDIRERDVETIDPDVIFSHIRFDFDSAALQDAARATLDEHANTLKIYDTMEILIQGHCDERGTVEYNLALGERRANSVYNYLMNLGIDASRMRTISYGKEFPLDPGHTESAWDRNRRAQFEITAK